MGRWLVQHSLIYSYDLVILDASSPSAKNLKEKTMLPLRYLSWVALCAILFATLAPALPAQAAARAARPSPIRQDDVADRIAEIRNAEPDLEDDFATYGLFETGYDGTTAVYLKSGELRIAVDEENTLAWSAIDRELADFYVEVDAIHREGSLDNQFGFLVRMDAEPNYYLFAASSDGWYTIQMLLEDEWEPLVDWTESAFIEVGEGSVNTLGLLAEGDTYTFLINDTIVDDVTDNTLDGTLLALNAAAFGSPPVDIGFDNFRLWYVGEPVVETPRQAPVDARNITVTPAPPVTAEPTDTATPEVTEEVTEEATEEPTPEFTAIPPDGPTAEPTEEATEESTEEPTVEPTEEATVEITLEPTEEPTAEATPEPTTAAGTSSDPVIAAIQGQPATYSDDFEDGDASDWVSFTSDTVAYSVVDGAYEFAFNTANVLTWSELPALPINYYIEADATIVSPVEAAEYGIIFNYLDSQNFYLYAVNNANRFSVWRLVNNAWEVIHEWTDSSVLVAGDGNTNRLGLLVQDNTITLAANDEVLAEITVEDASLGSVALAAGTFEEPNLTIHFDNVLLWDLDEIGPLPSPAPTGAPTAEPTAEPTDEPVSDEFAELAALIDDIRATEPDIVDEFPRDSGTWDTAAHDFGEYYYEARAFHIVATAEERIVWSAYYEDEVAVDPVQFDDFYAEFDTSFVTLTGENAAGLVFRLVDTDNFYKFVVDEIGYFQLQKRVNGEYSDIIAWDITDAADDSEGAVNRIGVLAQGSTLAFVVNGTVIARAEDTDLESGGIALAIQTYSTPEGHSIFDNFELWDLSE